MAGEHDEKVQWWMWLFLGFVAGGLAYKVGNATPEPTVIYQEKNCSPSTQPTAAKFQFQTENGITQVQCAHHNGKELCKMRTVQAPSYPQ